MIEVLEQRLDNELSILLNKKQTSKLTTEEDNTLYLGTDFRGIILEIARR